MVSLGGQAESKRLSEVSPSDILVQSEVISIIEGTMQYSNYCSQPSRLHQQLLAS